MGIVHDVLIDGGVEFAGTIGDAELEALFEEATGYCSTEADARTTYLTDSLEILDRHRDFEPSASEIRDFLRGDDLADWRKVVTVSAYVTMREVLGHQVEKDVAAIRAALDEAMSKGFRGVALFATCPHGWAAHRRESGWTSEAVLFEWTNLDGDADVSVLAIPVSGGDRIWMQLQRGE